MFKKRNLKGWLIGIYLLFCAIPIVIISVVLNNSYLANIQDNVYSSMKKANEQASESISLYLKDSETLLDIVSDEKIAGFFESVPSKYKEDEIMKGYANILRTKSNLEDIFLISLDNVNNLSFRKGFFVSSITTTSQEWYLKTKENPGRVNISQIHSEDYSASSSGNKVITLSKMIYNRNSEQLGMLLVDLSFSRLENIFKSARIGDRGIVLILDENGKAIYNSRANDDNKNLEIDFTKINLSNNSGKLISKINNEKTLIYYNTSDYSGWKFLNIVYEKEALKPFYKITWFSLIAIALWLVLCIFIYYIFAQRITKLLNLLKDKMSKASEGDMGITVKMRGPAEIVELGDNFNKLISRINYLMKRNSDEQKIIRMSELKALQAQINPHFLYNTLDAIVWLAEDNCLEQVITMTLALARFFRIGISKGKDVIALSEEIEHVRNYMIIQSHRYANKFQYIIDVSQDILQFKTPKLILQPFVENAIYHGIKNKESLGMIKILGLEVDNKIFLEIIDNGAGMTNETLERVQASLEDNTEETEKKSFGMKNVHERIQLLFGKEYGVKVFSEFGRETRVEILLPIMKEET